MNDEQLLKKKNRLRRELLIKRRSLPEDYLCAAGNDIAECLLASSMYAEARSIFVYVSVPGEPPTDRIIIRALSEGREVYVPKCSGGDMFAVRIKSPGDLRPGNMGIPEPEDISETKTARALPHRRTDAGSVTAAAIMTDSCSGSGKMQCACAFVKCSAGISRKVSSMSASGISSPKTRKRAFRLT